MFEGGLVSNFVWHAPSALARVANVSDGQISVLVNVDVMPGRFLNEPANFANREIRPGPCGTGDVLASEVNFTG